MSVSVQRDLVEQILRQLADAAPQLATFINVISEFQKTLIIRQDIAPAGWTKMVLPAVAAFQHATMDFKSREDWDRTIQTLIDLYGYV